MTTAAAGIAIEVDGLVKRYGGRTVVDGVTLRVERGEICALLGPNGAGKTTTAEVIEGYRRPDAGSVRVLGEDPARAGTRHRARIGLMLQQGGIDPRMRPMEVLRLYSRFFHDPWDPVALLDTVGLHGVAGTPYRRLSGGERQRLGLALALVGRPEVLVLDEPTAGMDPQAKAVTRDLVASLRDDGAAVLLATHELADVERMADRIVVLVNGQVVAAGRPGELLGEDAPRLRFTLAERLTDADLATLGAHLGGSLVAGDDGKAFLLEGPPVTPRVVAELASWCADRGLRITTLRAAGGTLEERYLELVGRDAT